MVTPNKLEVGVVFGAGNVGWLVALSASARSWNLRRSRILKVLKRETLISGTERPRKSLHWGLGWVTSV